MEFTHEMLKDLGMQEEVIKAYPTAVVGGAFESSFITPSALYTALVHIVPAGFQLKLLFLRVCTQQAGGARFSIIQVNPSATGQTGTVEAFPVKGSVPPFTAGATAARDYPMLEAAGAEVLRGGLEDPVHVFEGSIIFNILDVLAPLNASRYNIVWWGVQASQKR